MTAIAARRIDRQRHPQEAGQHQERLEAGRQVRYDVGGRPAVHHEELLDMPEPFSGLQRPAGPEEPGDDPCTRHSQGLRRDGRAHEGAEDRGGKVERQGHERRKSRSSARRCDRGHGSSACPPHRPRPPRR